MTPSRDLLVTPQALHREVGEAPATVPLVIDTRPTHEFARGQIPGSVHLDLWGVSLIDTSEAPLGAFMWMIGHLLSLRGVSPDRPVVACEQDAGLRAARLLWFLHVLGHPNVRILDGGIGAWTRAGLALSTEPVAPVHTSWHGEVNAAVLATWQDVLGRLTDSDTTIVDTRSTDEYRGRVVRAKRGGAIPGARHLEWTSNLTPDGRFKTPEELRQTYAAIGVKPDQKVITYCQGGYRAAHTYVALKLAGFADVQNYTGSWKEWGDREDLPIERP